MDKRSQQREDLRPMSEQMTDVAVFIVPPELWKEQLHSAGAQIISETVSAGFIRVHPETKVYQLREEIETQLEDDVPELLPKNYVFLKNVGRCLTRVRSKQERQLKVKSFMSPQSFTPEIFILEATADNTSMFFPSSLSGSVRSVDSRTEDPYQIESFRDPGKREFNPRRPVPPIATETNRSNYNDHVAPESPNDSKTYRVTYRDSGIDMEDRSKQSSSRQELTEEPTPPQTPSDTERVSPSLPVNESELLESISEVQPAAVLVSEHEQGEKTPSSLAAINESYESSGKTTPVNQIESQEAKEDITTIDESRWQDVNSPSNGYKNGADQQNSRPDSDDDRRRWREEEEEQRGRREEEEKQRQLAAAEEERRREEQERRRREEEKRLEEAERRARERQETEERRKQEEERRKQEEMRNAEQARKKEEERRAEEERLRAQQVQNTKSSKEQKEELQNELETLRNSRKETEQKREDLIKKAKQLQGKAHSKRTQARDVWKKRYFDEKKKTGPLEEQNSKLKTDVDLLQRKVLTAMEGQKDKEVRTGRQPPDRPSEQSNMKIQAARLQNDIDDVQTRLQTVKLKLTTEMKLRNQAETELKAIKAEVTQNKISASLNSKHFSPSIEARGDLTSRSPIAAQS